MHRLRTNASLICLACLLGVGCSVEPTRRSASDESKQVFEKTPPMIDGARVVAMGRPPIAFLYPGTGRLSVRNLDTDGIVFTVELPAATSGAERTMISVSADGKLTGRTASGGVTDIAMVNKAQTYAITYLSPEQMK